MRRLLLVFALCATSLLALAPAALAQQGTDLDCSQLGAPGTSPEAAQAEAQALLDADPSDPNALDADGDGIACEFTASPDGEVTFEDGTGFVSDAAAPAPVQEPSSDLDCAAFTSQAEVQAALEADANDPYDLDADGDGIACNELFTEDPPLTAEEPPVQYETPQSPGVTPDAIDPVSHPTEPDVAGTGTPETPVTSVQPPDPAEEQLPATGGFPLLVPALAGAALLGLVSTRRRRA